jgi:thiol-disulfide isomerase/thioredoxin
LPLFLIKKLKMAKYLLVFFLSLYLKSALSQSIDQCKDSATTIFENINKSYSKIKSGQITYEIVTKPLLRSDSLTYKLKIYFNKNRLNNDSIASTRMDEIVYNNSPSIRLIFDNTCYAFYDSTIIAHKLNHESPNAFKKELRTLTNSRLYIPFVNASISAFKMPDLNTCEISKKSDSGKEAIQVTFSEMYDHGGYDSITYSINSSNWRILCVDKSSFVTEYNDIYKSSLYVRDEINNLPKIDLAETLDSLINLGYNFIHNDGISKESIITDSMKSVPEWKLIDGNEMPFSNKDINSKLYLMDFSYLACPACLKSIPSLNNLINGFAENELTVFWVNPIEFKQKEYILKKLKEFNIQFNVYFDETHQLSKQINVDAFPTSFLVETKSGKVLKHLVGFNIEEMSNLEEFIKNYLKLH